MTATGSPHNKMFPAKSGFTYIDADTFPSHLRLLGYMPSEAHPDGGEEVRSTESEQVSLL